MKCIAACMANTFALRKLYKHFQSKQTLVNLHHDVLHILEKDDRHIFVFLSGVYVAWGLSAAEEKRYQKIFLEFSDTPLKELVRDQCEVGYAQTNKVDDAEDIIYLKSKDPLAKLALSYGLSQSVKLEVFENVTDATIEETRYIPKNLAQTGKISLTRREISQWLGRLYLQRSLVNLQLDFLDTPEFFWENTDLEPIYQMVRSYLNIKGRLEVINARMVMLHDLFEMLNGQLQHQHSVSVEWIIVWLIVSEVGIVLIKDVLHWI